MNDFLYEAPPVVGQVGVARRIILSLLFSLSDGANLLLLPPGRKELCVDGNRLAQGQEAQSLL